MAVVAGENERARSVFGERSVGGCRGAGDRQRSRGVADIDLAGGRSGESEVAVRRGVGASVEERASAQDKIPSSVGCIAEVAGHSPVCNGSYAKSAAVDCCYAGIGICIGQRKSARAILGEGAVAADDAAEDLVICARFYY